MKEALKLFWIFFKIGSVTFGSGYVIVTVVQKEIVQKRKWFTEEEYLNYISISTSSPGPIVINLASLIGHQRLGLKGLIAGFLGSSLPSFIILLIIAISFSSINDSPIVVAVFKGLRPAVIGLILTPVIGFAKKVNKWEYPIFIIIALLLYLNLLSAILIIVAGILTGVLVAYFKSKKRDQ